MQGIVFTAGKGRLFNPIAGKLLTDYAEKNGITILKVYKEAKSAKSTGRTQFGKMIEFLKQESKKKSKDICRIILVEKMDRLVRNFSDAGTVSQLGVDLHLVKQGFVINEDTPPEMLLASDLWVSVSTYFIRNLRREVIKGMKQKASEGLYPSKAPLGYLNASENVKKIIVPDKDRVTAINKIFEWYASGHYSLKDIAINLFKENFINYRIAKSRIHAILINPIYYGAFK